MIKYTILLFNVLGLFIYQLFFQAGVTVNQTVPATANAGSTFVVQVTINKADLSGFAKFEEDLPAGFTATAVDKQGATVLSSDNAIKFIWASLPSDATVTISFQVKVDSTVTGTQSLAAKFLYVINNEKQESDAPNASITIIGKNGPVAATVTVPDTTKQAPASNMPIAMATMSNTPDTTKPVSVPAPAGPTVTVTRTLSSNTVAPAGDITVTLTIHKGNITGFAKLEESMPDNMVITDGDNQGASFTFVDNKVKFVWLSLTLDSVLTVSYKISVGSTVSGNQSLTGEFSYLVDNNAEKVEVAPSSFMVDKNASQPVAQVAPPVAQPAETTQPVAQITPPVANVTQPVSSSQPVDNTQTASNTAALPVVAPAVNTPAPVVDNTPPATSVTDIASSVTPHINASSGGVKYRVQIMALHKPIKTSYLAKKFNITETINQEMLEGYTKYTVGRFDEYKAVHDHREEIRSKGVEGPFVVAYNAGKRITVQEALMITHQQWYK